MWSLFSSFKNWTLLIKKTKGPDALASHSCHGSWSWYSEWAIKVLYSRCKPIFFFFADYVKKNKASFDDLSVEDFPQLPRAVAPWSCVWRDHAKKTKRQKLALMVFQSRIFPYCLFLPHYRIVLAVLKRRFPLSKDHLPKVRDLITWQIRIQEGTTIWCQRTRSLVQCETQWKSQ